MRHVGKWDTMLVNETAKLNMKTRDRRLCFTYRYWPRSLSLDILPWKNILGEFKVVIKPFLKSVSFSNMAVSFYDTVSHSPTHPISIQMHKI